MTPRAGFSAAWRGHFPHRSTARQPQPLRSRCVPKVRARRAEEDIPAPFFFCLKSKDSPPVDSARMTSPNVYLLYSHSAPDGLRGPSGRKRRGGESFPRARECSRRDISRASNCLKNLFESTDAGGFGFVVVVRCRGCSSSFVIVIAVVRRSSTDDDKRQRTTTDDDNDDDDDVNDDDNDDRQ